MYFFRRREGFLIEIGVIGGDKREEVLINILAEKGYKIRVLHTPVDSPSKNIEYYDQLEPVVREADLVLAPMSSTDQNGYLKSTFVDRKIRLDKNFFEELPSDAVFMIGVARPDIQELLYQREIDFIELARLDELAILNAIPTAEGAIKIAIEETPFTIFGSRVLVLGLGKVGLTLAWRLKALGAECYAVTRDRGAMARGKDLGIKMIKYEEIMGYLPEFDILFNTVPAKIIGREYISVLKKNAVIIDLASSPGGTDFRAAEEKGLKAILALGLPGKIAPETGGEILGEVISDLIKKG